jgi:hypothetical protein
MSREQQEYWEVQAWQHEVEYFARIEKQSITHKTTPATHQGGKHYKFKDQPF